jgi:Sulfotransferase domain
MNNNKIFIIGFNKTGTRTLHHYFKNNNIPSIHWDQGILAIKMDQNFKSKQKLLKGYNNYIVYSDMEHSKKQIYAHVKYYKQLDKQYPGSKFILNIRNVDNWINSRNNHKTYTADICKILNLTKAELNQKWKQDYHDHISDVIDYFSNKQHKLLVFDIEKDSIKQLNDFLPDLKLNPELYVVKGRTGTNNKTKGK